MVMERAKLSITMEEKLTDAAKIYRFNNSPSSPFFSLSAAFSKQDASSGGGGGDRAGSENSSTDQREHMFDKVVTPSDVGKLNRLVIPKQQAERCFPLDASTNEKGLLLCFEDSAGKAWRFRYSYWNSSQSYVMTKGWSRFVKDKRLNAGDTVSFSRGIGDACRDRLYIDWRRWRPDQNCDPLRSQRFSVLSRVRVPFTQPWGSRINLVPSLAMGAPMYSTTTHDLQANAYGFGNVVRAIDSERQHLIYLGRPPALLRAPWTAVQDQGCSGSRGQAPPMVRNALSFIHNRTAASKKIRIFGVDLEYPDQLQSDASCSSGLQAVTTELQLLLPPPSVPLQASSHGAAESSNV